MRILGGCPRDWVRWKTPERITAKPFAAVLTEIVTVTRMTDQSAPKPSPKPGPRPGPRPGPVPGPRPGVAPLRPAAPAAAAPTISTADAATEAAKFGRVGEDGTVYVADPAGERAVGQYPDAGRDEALAYYYRKFADLAAQVSLLEQRAASGAPATDLRAAASALAEQIPTADVVGDLPGLSKRIDEVMSMIDRLAAEQAEAAEAARAEAYAAREAIVVEAESFADADPTTLHWKQSSARMTELFDEWKSRQSSGPRLSKTDDHALWSRFRTARHKFDKHRREYFSKLDQHNAEAKRIKNKLIEEAEKLSTSTDWAAASAEYRRLMSDWKAAPRASRKDDDALWARFRAAQDVFFSARDRKNAEIDAEYAENLKVKEKLLEQAEALLPVSDPASAKAALRKIQDEWEEAGKVPRSAMHSVESRLRAVERAVQAEEDAKWRRSNPEGLARAEGALSQLDDSIAALERDLESAKSTGDEKKVAKANEALEARRAWREQVAKAAEDFS